jgi:hypothetical protein
MARSSLGEDLNVIFYQNMPNLHNWYKSPERKISQKNLEYLLNIVKISKDCFKLYFVNKKDNCLYRVCNYKS